MGRMSGKRMSLKWFSFCFSLIEAAEHAGLLLLFVSLASNLFPSMTQRTEGSDARQPAGQSCHSGLGPQPGHCSHLPGQASFLQALVSRASPSHGFPFIWGLGELQSRILVITPSPQVTEQDDHGDQWLQPPSCLTTAQSRWL